MTLKIAVLAPMPRPSVRMNASENPGMRGKVRSARRISLITAAPQGSPCPTVGHRSSRCKTWMNVRLLTHKSSAHSDRGRPAREVPQFAGSRDRDTILRARRWVTAPAVVLAVEPVRYGEDARWRVRF